MAKYKVQYHYNTRGPDGTVLGWTKGTVVELDDAIAEWVERDCTGLLVPVVEVPEDAEPDGDAPPPAEPVEAIVEFAPAADEASADEPAASEEPEGNEAEPEPEVTDEAPQRDRSHRAGRRRH